MKKANHVCCKCGSKEINTFWHLSNYRCVWGSNHKPNYEHMHYYCQTCTYDWTGQPMDSKYVAEGGKDE